jgi:hypothetical protein
MNNTMVIMCACGRSIIGNRGVTAPTAPQIQPDVPRPGKAYRARCRLQGDEGAAAWDESVTTKRISALTHDVIRMGGDAVTKNGVIGKR